MILKSITKWSMRLPLMARSWEPPKQGDDTASHENEEHNNSVRSGVAQQTPPASPGSLDQGDVLGQSFRLDADTITACNACNAASNTTPAFSCRAARSCFAEDSCQRNRLDKCAQPAEQGLTCSRPGSCDSRLLIARLTFDWSSKTSVGRQKLSGARRWKFTPKTKAPKPYVPNHKLSMKLENCTHPLTHTN